MSNSLRPYRWQHARLPCPSLLSGVCLNSRHWVSDAIQPSSCLLPLSLPALNLSQHQGLPVSQFFTSGGQRIGASASASVLPMNIQGWFPFGLTGLISLKSKGLSRVSSSITIWKHQIFGTQPCLWFNSHMPIREYWKIHGFDYMDLCWQSNVLLFNMLSKFVIAFLPRSKCLSI